MDGDEKVTDVGEGHSKVIAVLAPSSGAAAIFPHLREQGVRRLESLMGMPAKLMPTAKLAGAALTPEVRAADLNSAFADPQVAAIVCTIGGDESVRVLPLLDREILSSNPKPLLGYSDATSLHLYLFSLGVLSLYGGALLCQFAISGPGMHEYTATSVRHALLTPELPLRVRPSEAFQDGYLEWADEANLPIAKALEPNPGWEWVGWRADVPPVTGALLFGGCLDVLYAHLATRKYWPQSHELAGAALFVETSEEFPSAYVVYSFFQSLGEIGLLQSLAAVLVGRPQTVCRGVCAGPGGDRKKYRTEQRAAILRAMDEYCKVGAPIPIVFGLDFGHTDPQVLVPSGGSVDINGVTQEITFHYSRGMSRG